jgi:16S rRNA (uracil1498-N3)-methyltransferase
VPVVEPVRQLAAWLPLAPQGLRLLLNLGPQVRSLAEHAARWAPGAAVCTLSGPEGGLTAAEEAAALAAGFVATGLGPRVLRAETAPLAALAWLALQDDRTTRP